MEMHAMSSSMEGPAASLDIFLKSVMVMEVWFLFSLRRWKMNSFFHQQNRGRRWLAGFGRERMLIGFSGYGELARGR
jgi:hypothetical protein